MNINKVSFSVLMSVYKNDNSEFLNEAIESIVKQTIVPSEIVIVKDGPLNLDLDNVLSKWVVKLPNIIKLISLDNNLGLGEALKIGMENCTYDIIARMDSDDISEKNRFEDQFSIFINKDIDIVGSYVDEFSDSVNNILSLKKVPIEQYEIYKCGRYRCPMNHPTVMFRKKSVNDAGGYRSWHYNEDYDLWIRMINNKAKFYNIPKALVHMRVSDGTYERRGGLNYFKSEFKLQKLFLKEKYISLPIFIFNVLVRMGVQILIPNRLRMLLYKFVFRKSGLDM